MFLKAKNSLVYFCLIASVVLEHYYSNEGFTLYLLASTLVLVLLKGQVPINKPLRTILPFVLIVIIGVCSSNLSESYFLLKDLFYHFKIFICFFFAFVCFMITKDVDKILFSLVVSISILCTIHLIQVSMRPDLLFPLNGLGLRQKVGIGINGSPYVILLIAYLSEKGFLKRRNYRIIAYSCVLVCVLSIVFSFSRTHTGALLLAISVLILRNHLLFYRLSYSVVFCLLIFITLGVFDINIKLSDVSMEESFILWKYANSLGEVSFKEYGSIGENLVHIRGYEGFRVMQIVKQGTVLEKLFGFGFGTFMDWSDVYVHINKNPKVAIYHNGFLGLLIRTGIVGLGLYLWFTISILYKRVRSFSRKTNRLTEALFVFIGCDILFTTFVVGGFYNIHTMYCSAIIIAVLLGHISWSKKTRRHEARGRLEVIGFR